SVDLADENKLSPLMIAAMQGNVDTVREFISRVMNLEATDRNGWSALHYAIASRNRETVNLLLSVMPILEAGNSGLLDAALDAGDEKIIGAIAGRLARMQDWTNATRRALGGALRSEERRVG